MKYALKDFWGDLAGWFFLGILLAGLITTLIPEDIFARYLGSGLPAMLLMLVIGIPLYICATASTPIAAALILKGVSPGAALVFLLAGPATNVAALTVLFGILGKRAAAVYLAAIALCSVGCGLLLDQIYGAWGLSAQAMIGQTSELMPFWLEASAVMILLAISIKPMGERLKTIAARFRHFRSALSQGRPAAAAPHDGAPEGRNPVRISRETFDSAADRYGRTMNGIIATIGFKKGLKKHQK